MTKAFVVPDAPVAAARDLCGARALLAVAGLFTVNGVLIGGFGGTLPAMRQRLAVDAGGLGVLLVSFSVGAVLSMQIGGRLADSRGARNVALPACAVLICGMALLAFAPTLLLACAAAALAGLGNGAMDVSMNALGVRVERARGKPVMSRLHACFSIGTLAGAASVVLIARVVGEGGVVVTPALASLSVLCAVAFLTISRWVPRTASVRAVTRPGGGPRLPAGALLLGAMAFSFGLAEGTAMDWSSVQVTDVARVEPSTGALGLVAVSSFMVLIRLFGDRAVAVFGRANVVRSGGLVASAGYLVAILGQSLPILLVGWALVGLGVGMIAPQVYAAAGHAGGGRMLAVVVTFGYGAFLVGPAIVGALARQVGISHAMALPMSLSVLLVVLSRGLSRSEPAGRTPELR